MLMLTIIASDRGSERLRIRPSDPGGGLWEKIRKGRPPQGPACELLLVLRLT